MRTIKTPLQFILYTAIFTVHFLILSCNQPGKKKENGNKEEDTTTVNRFHIDTDMVQPERPPATTPVVNTDLDFLKTLNGKYPHDLKLLENESFVSRLRQLLGDRYAFLKENWAVETPMEYTEPVFSASACQAHNCGETNFIIVYDFNKHSMYAGIRENGKVKTYSENGEETPKITAWSKE